MCPTQVLLQVMGKFFQLFLCRKSGEVCPVLPARNHQQSWHCKCCPLAALPTIFYENRSFSEVVRWQILVLASHKFIWESTILNIKGSKLNISYRYQIIHPCLMCSEQSGVTHGWNSCPRITWSSEEGWIFQSHFELQTFRVSRESPFL